MSANLQLFDHILIDNRAAKTCFLFHGTDGSKEDFLFLNEKLSRDYNLVGLQGNVDEQGMKRFFKRLAMGVFDQESIRQEATKLERFLRAWEQQYKMSTNNFSFLGYSNGANMIMATMFLYPELVRTAALLHPMLPFEPEPIDLSKHKLFISQGINDEMVSPQHQKELVQVLQKLHPQLTVKEYASGHRVTATEVQDVTKFLIECAHADSHPVTS